jgi:hypothetical protein
MLLGAQSIELFSQTNRADVARIIDDAHRAELAGESMRRANARVQLLIERRELYLARLSEIDQQFDTPKSQYEPVLEQLWEERASAQADYLKEIFTLRNNMTREEWETVFSLESQNP